MQHSPDGPVVRELEPNPGMPASVWRLRLDAWEYVRYAVRLLARGDTDLSDAAGLSEIHRSLRALETVEMYWAGFGQRYVKSIRSLIDAGEYRAALDRIGPVMQRMRGSGSLDAPERPGESEQAAKLADEGIDASADARPRFEVLVVDEMSPADRDNLKIEMLRMRAEADDFIYDLVIVPSVEDAIAAALTNPNLQVCVIRPGFTGRSTQALSRDLRRTITLAYEQYGGTGKGRSSRGTSTQLASIQRIVSLADTLRGIRPELDLYLVAGAHIEDLAGALSRRFRRVFRREDRFEMHLSFLRRISHVYDAPFFTAIQEHARRPAGVFHALPVSRGGSVVGSKWIRDMADFYGLNLLLAETSATSGGLDSLLAPVHTLKKAQELAARAFHSDTTWFVTNGTSTANKIVHQAVTAPGDIVIVDRNCHKSHHHALMLSGARVAYLDAYPLNDYAFYGAVPVNRIKQLLLDYRAAGRLDEVRMVTLTNCTFDGIVYDPERVMAECLAIKPDLVFLWDEAWFAFAAFHPVTRRRTAMSAAKQLEALKRSAEHADAYAKQRARLFDAETGEPVPDDVWLGEQLLVPPDATLRVYATQSTHKTLTALRQGSMIHVRDQVWRTEAEEAFHEAYMTHTSTSPNYQILASLDIGRRQVELEGFELVQRQLDLATSVAHAVARHPLLKKTFRVLTTHDLVPAEYRSSKRPMPHRDGLSTMWEAWAGDEFVVDPSRITVEITRTGVDGDTFKHEYLMDRYGIQVNKTSQNTVLFMTNIGTSRSAVAYLIEVLVKLAEQFQDDEVPPTSAAEPADRSLPPLPDFSEFAGGYRAADGLPDGDIRTAYYAGLRGGQVELVPGEELRRRVAAGERPVSAGFVTPYPPGFPVLVPGQVITPDVLAFMAVLDTREIHGYDARQGYRIMPEPTG
ncbi:amino acid decarboxylase [Pseudoclavibacter endophyticus]|uniref:Ornithine decarboxylase n=1 Tax=Pseudoclavibacter endophyticus TaxID=1778590 RepID=A0A6H9WML4_9MICO|nr:aminotransferase class I/II-fold pyridoxal phosphate-dependent enzyme [Pseudoclavibacter endophyticus]KAB1650116.1 ornithine decarboxylase [Pseudoclavibacter endophyticus]GGA57092.1 amino acid decarboxylase [Pseudoclavibacter endophyticus]